MKRVRECMRVRVQLRVHRGLVESCKRRKVRVAMGEESWTSWHAAIGGRLNRLVRVLCTWT